MRHFIKLLCCLIVSTMLFNSQFALSGSKDKGAVLVTGANRGIGLALVTKFKEQGYSIISTARKPEKAKELMKMDVRIEQLDVTNAISVSALKNKLDGTSIDILINNSGIGGHGARTFAQIDIEKLKRVLDVNSLGALRVTTPIKGKL